MKQVCNNRDVWFSALEDFDKAYWTHLRKVEKNMEEGTEDDPSNKCEFNHRK
eukprot:Pgem_evm1s18586